MSSAPPQPPSTSGATGAAAATAADAAAEPSDSSADLAAKRTDYYNKWDKLAAETEKSVASEEAADAQQSAEKLGLKADAPKSEAEARDREKRTALKAAKKQWDERKLSEVAMRAVLGENAKNISMTVKEADLGEKRVVFFKGARNSEFTLPASLNVKLVKVFIEDCKGCVFHVEQTTISSHLEIAKCDDCSVNVRASSHVVQADLCTNLQLRFAENVFLPGQHKIFHAGLRDSKVIVEGGSSDDSAVHTEEVCFATVQNAAEHNAEHPEEVQYVSHFKDGRLVTERVFRSRGNMPLTASELAAVEALGDGDGLQSAARAAELKKLGGNEAFEEGNYAQACVFYREAIDLAPGGDAAALAVLWSNLAFARQKLGHHEEALDAASEALKLDANMTKARFRKGLALHALQRYREAAEELSRALDAEPKNPQIKQALGFAQMRLQRGG